MSVEQALTEFIQSLNTLRQAMDQEYLEQSKILGCRIRATLDIYQKYFAVVTLGNWPEWQKRLLNNLWVLWSPPSSIESTLLHRTLRRRPSISLFPLNKEVS